MHTTLFNHFFIDKLAGLIKIVFSVIRYYVDFKHSDWLKIFDKPIRMLQMRRADIFFIELSPAIFSWAFEPSIFVLLNIEYIIQFIKDTVPPY